MDEIELAGRIEAVTKFVLHLTAELEMAGLIDGPRFGQRLRGEARMEDQIEYIQVGRRRLEGMLDKLDQARVSRSAARKPTTR